MSASTSQHKAPWILAILLLAQIVLMSTNARDPNTEQSIFRTWVMTVFTPVGNAIDSVVSSITGGVGSYTDVRGAREENIRLKAEIERVTAERNEATERAAEYDRLRAQLALPPRAAYREIAASVVARETSIWYRRLTIDRGTVDGVKVNMPVGTAVGIVGRVIAVGPNWATIQVITDKHAGVGAMLQTSRAMGEVRGRDPEGSTCELQNIHTSEKVEVGETVITTGLDRIYPKGLVVGKVERIENDPNAPWHKIIVAPAAPVDRLEHVLVMLVEQKDLKMEETNK
ncbi:MAG TPA: rod shape-determining protein MreC [Blastocatellia bacterium]|nr:rod shape-determining protein MreC [Blastocatellia bacterium]